MADGGATLSYTFAREQGVVVLGEGTPARLGVRADVTPYALLEARRALAVPVNIETLQPAAFERALAETYAIDGLASEAVESGLAQDESLDRLIERMPTTTDLLEVEDEAPIIRLINGLIAEAVKVRASDIHIESFESTLAVRFRVDGVLQDMLQLSSRAGPVLVSRVKVMARLDIAERRLPQDGRISLTIGGRNLDVRVSTLPAQYGERVVMRLLDKTQGQFDIDRLGMAPAVSEGFRQALRQPNGIILVTGPTGSGKTTTLYAGLNRLNDHARNILTVEDPIEYAIQGIGQTQVNPRVGLTFAAGLRAILRQDPDIVMVGEIRDAETAQIAVQASLTGHLVLSTVHTNDAVSAITRLRDIGVEPFLLASTVRSVIAQRLVRRLCQHCKAPHTPDAAERAVMGTAWNTEATVFRARGCAQCKSHGYTGRIGIYELVTVDDDLRRLIHDNAPEHALTASAFRASENLLQSAMRHVAAGLTTIEEALRVCRRAETGDGLV